MTTTDDPIFAAIERHRQAEAALLAFEYAEEDDAALAEMDRLCDVTDAAAWALVETQPTTLAGCIAILKYVADEGDGERWPPEDWDSKLHATLSDALQKIA
jgi:hypothetical protein